MPCLSAAHLFGAEQGGVGGQTSPPSPSDQPAHLCWSTALSTAVPVGNSSKVVDLPINPLKLGLCVNQKVSETALGLGQPFYTVLNGRTGAIPRFVSIRMLFWL